MVPKYEPLARLLQARHPLAVTMTFAELDALVGGLPPSARSEPSWWGNTTNVSRTQAKAWMGADYRAENVKLGVAVTFVQSSEIRGRRRVSGRHAQVVLDGVDQLTTLLLRAGYPSVLAAVAEHAVFLHPDTVAQTGGSALFPIVRDMFRRGQFGTARDGRPVFLDDNTSPTHAFVWSAGRTKGRDVQFNHVWNDAGNRDAYTALWNLCATPAFLAKTTDGSNHPDVIAALRYRAYRLYGVTPAGAPIPIEPEGFQLLRWAPHPEPLASLEAVLRTRLRANMRSRTARACRELGWLFSGWQPDASI